MVAVLQAASPPEIELAPAPAGTGWLLSPEALAFVADLHGRFDARRLTLLAARRERQRAYDAGALPDFRADTAAIRAGDWRVAPIPAALQDRRVEITGPVDPKMVINALNSGAQCYMADFEDSTSPTWANLLAGQATLHGAVRGTLSFTSDAGKAYALRPEAEQAVLIVRPRGLHLDEKHLRIGDGRVSPAPVSASLFDLGLFCFHNSDVLAAKDRGPYFYLPKLQSMEEAALWQDVLTHVEDVLGLPQGQIKVTVLIETLPAAFEMDEILHALRNRIVGLNCGRWDYIFSYIKTLRGHRTIFGRSAALPERGQVTMTQPFLKAYADLLIRTCHRRGAHAMGGMAAQIPISGNDEANAAALDRVRADKLREVTAGHDGTWVAHPALIPLARELFDAHMPQPHQHHVLREDAVASRDALLAPPHGTITRAGFEGNVEVCVRYLAAWLAGNGCVPIHHLMEDAATAEIARTQLWQWLHHGDLHLSDGTPIDGVLLDRALLNLPSRLAAEPLPGADRVPQALALLETLTAADTLEDFLTVPAYDYID